MHHRGRLFVLQGYRACSQLHHSTMSQEDTRSVIEEISSSTIPTPRHEEYRPGTEDLVGQPSPDNGPYPPGDEEEETPFSRSANPDPVSSHTPGQAFGGEPGVPYQRRFADSPLPIFRRAGYGTL